MIIVTGAAGFIGSNLVAGLNQRGETDILAVDDLTDGNKFVNLARVEISDYLDRDAFRSLVACDGLPQVRAVFHQGACSDTTERDGHYMMDNNYRVSMELFQWCQEQRVPFFYASSAAVYGAGPTYIEDPAHEAPLNVYGYSKYLFDQVVRRHLPSLVAPVVGLRYFNVYGPNEQHKGRMASVARHNMYQFLNDGHVRLFGAWDGYEAGQQERDFIYVDDVVAVNMHFLDNEGPSGIYNCGTGRAQPFNDVAAAVINGFFGMASRASQGLDKLVQQDLIQYISFPDDLKGRYQSHTRADLTQLRDAGYDRPFMDVSEGVEAYMAVLHNRGEFPLA